MSKDPLSKFPEFSLAVARRMKAGREEYGDVSFHAHPLRLLAEIKEELLDVAGWSFTMYVRLEEMEQKVSALGWEKLEAEIDEE